MNDLSAISNIAAAGMKAQGVRMRVISENLANADTLGTTPGAKPYQRKVVTFRETMDRQLGVEKVDIKKIDVDATEFQMEFNPGHPAANETGYVLKPNVNPLIEMMDMREAQRSYEANLTMIEVTRQMTDRTMSLLDQQ